MRKRKLMLKAALVCSLATCMGLYGCQKTNAEKTTTEATATTGTATETTSEEAKSDEVTVTLIDTDGTTELGKVSVKKGEAANIETPEKEGYTFVAWYTSPKKTRRFDMEQKITEDTKIYAGFASYKEDTRDFYIVGGGTSAVLTESNWGAVVGDNQKFTKEANAEANVYTYTVELKAGDEFQFATNEKWEDQRGFGYLDSVQADGTTYFKKTDGLGATDAKKSNIQVLVDGSYTFTLVTYPAEDVYDTNDSYYTEETKESFNMNPYDTITFVYNGQ